MKAKQILRSTLAAFVGTIGLVGLSTSIHAQGVDIEVPVLIIEDTGTGPADDGELDLANIVMSAAKGVTTVQEAPAIITVITAEEFKEKGWTTIWDALDTVPGYLKLHAINNQMSNPLTRGVLQGMMFLRDGVSMFDPIINVPTISRITPVELVKRVEFVTGPGGVLWGANAFFGIANMITKDASDVDGVETDVAFGHGNGDREFLRGYVMTGIEDLWDNDSSLLLHTSFESFVEAGYDMPSHLFSTPSPNPNSRMIYGPLVRASPGRSFIFNLNGKLQFGKVTVNVTAPYVTRHSSLGFAGAVSRQELPEDSLRNDDGSLACDPNNLPDSLGTPDDRCHDVARRGRANDLRMHDRFITGEYRTRLAGGKAGLTVKAYGVQFLRHFLKLAVLEPLPGVLEGGLNFNGPVTAYRAGLMVDGDIELSGGARLLYGVEAFREWIPVNHNSRARLGEGVQATFFSPYNLGRLPLPCPRQGVRDASGSFTGEVEFVADCPLTFVFASSRGVVGGYVNPQWKISKNLTLDAGARVMVAPSALGELTYDPEPVFGAGLVYGFAKDWHLKLNYAEGFRPPIFSNLVFNGESVAIGGDLELKNEKSQAGQAEVNARLFKGERRIRELNFRADYSYSRVQNPIQFVGGRYENTDDRGIHTVEFLGKVFIQGGHQVNLSYTWNVVNTADKGRWRMTPENWFHLTGVFALSENLSSTSALRVIGAMEDPNRLIEYRPYEYDDEGYTFNTMTLQRDQLVIMPHELVLDRIPASADLTLGLAYTGIERLRLSAFAYNAFNGRYFQPDGFGDYSPRFALVPNPAPDFRFQVHATYSY